MKSSHLIWKSLTVIYLMVFLTIVVLAYRNGLPAFLMVNDKAGHVGLYGVATFLGHRAINRRSIKLWSRAVPLFPWLFGLLTIVEEGCQALSLHRSFDGFDLVASFFGIVVGYGLAELGKPKSAHLHPGNKSQ
jgi:glycopeptide antibiotics resistance protein